MYMKKRNVANSYILDITWNDRIDGHLPAMKFEEDSNCPPRLLRSGEGQAVAARSGDGGEGGVGIDLLKANKMRLGLLSRV